NEMQAMGKVEALTGRAVSKPPVKAAWQTCYTRQAARGHWVILPVPAKAPWQLLDAHHESIPSSPQASPRACGIRRQWRRASRKSLTAGKSVKLAHLPRPMSALPVAWEKGSQRHEKMRRRCRP